MKKTKKKRGSVAVLMLLSVMMAFIIIPMMTGKAYAAPTPQVTVDEIVYVLDTTNQTAAVKGYQDFRLTGHVTIQSSVTYKGNQYPVTKINDYAFENIDDLTGVTIPDSVTSIGRSAFVLCDKMTEVTIPDSVTSIGARAFSWCTSLTKINIPPGVTSIPDELFSYCRNLEEVSIPNTLKSIGSSAFSGCNSLKSITIPDGVTSIGGHAFESCFSLTEVTVPESVTVLEGSAFACCKNLRSVNIPSKITTLKSCLFLECKSLTELIIPDGVTTIEMYAIDGCDSLTEITLPDGLTTIGMAAFCASDNLTTINVPRSVTSIGEDAFYCKNLTRILIDCDFDRNLFTGSGVIPSQTDDSYTLTDSENVGHFEISHLFGQKKAAKKYLKTPATCTTPSVYYVSCSRCNVSSKGFGKDESTFKGKATGHNYGPWKKVSATQHQRICANDKSHVIKANHRWDSGKVTKKPTTKSTGTKTFTCKDCHATRTTTIPKLKPAAKPASAKANGILLAKMTPNGQKSLDIRWLKIPGAAGYDIFFSRCNHSGKDFVCKKIKTIKGNKTFKWTKTGLIKKTPYKAYVKAYVVKNGKKIYVGKSPMVHSYTSGGTKNFTNARSITLKQTKVTLKKGKTYTIKGTVNYNKKKTLMTDIHAPALRYLSANKKVATVNGSGKITARSKGSCTIYVYPHNGLYKKVYVTVK